MRESDHHSRHPEAGFAVSAEVLLIAVILVVGLITGWVKVRDQSLAEIKDSVNAIDAYVIGSTPMFQPYAQQWIVGGVVSCSSVTPPVPPATCLPPVTDQYLPPTGAPVTGGVLSLRYGSAPVVATTGSSATHETTVLF